ncbi:MAG: hypothetical protein IH862_09695 [Chloroflexi bacterium]|nr:hypothetical protein [Chloroflexota bacterium]
MAKLEKGSGKLLSVDTENSVLAFREVRRTVSSETPEPKEWELEYTTTWQDRYFFDLLDKEVEYVLSDGKVVKIDTKS